MATEEEKKKRTISQYQLETYHQRVKTEMYKKPTMEDVMENFEMDVLEYYTKAAIDALIESLASKKGLDNLRTMLENITQPKAGMVDMNDSGIATIKVASDAPTYQVYDIPGEINGIHVLLGDSFFEHSIYFKASAGVFVMKFYTEDGTRELDHSEFTKVGYLSVSDEGGDYIMSICHKKVAFCEATDYSAI